MTDWRRRPDWPERLDAAITRARHRPFAWGQQDCCLFAADCVLAITGQDPAAGFRCRYRSALGAGRLLTRLGGVPGLLDGLGFPAMPPAALRRGDLALTPTEAGPALAVTLGRHLAVPGLQHLVFVPRHQAHLAWRVG